VTPIRRLQQIMNKFKISFFRNEIQTMNELCCSRDLEVTQFP
jgi:hypothetical protein